MSNSIFNLATLLKLDDLDVRKTADATNMPVEKYFSMLSEFIDRAPQMIDSLNNIAAFDDVEESLRNLEDLRKSLTRLGYHKLSAPIGEIIQSSKDEDMALAIPFVVLVLEGFSYLFSRLITARMPEGGENPYEGLSLQNALDVTIKELSEAETSRKLKILAIDDMLFILQTISQVLSKEYRVYKLSNPTMLEESLQYVTPELFLLDCDMPQRSGFDLVPVIRSYEAHKTTPIIFLTSTGTADNISAAIKLGAVDYVVKPFQASLLRQKVAANIVRKNIFEA
ncbi:MAG: response regulator [Treponema sp.]|jgi:CheY-like chemotaxis protein|nr:response regulator [Treponema sp.]